MRAHTPLLEVMPPELIDLVLEKLRPSEAVSLMKTCRALRRLVGLAMNRDCFESCIIPRLLQHLVYSTGPDEERAKPETQRMAIAALNARVRYLGSDSNHLVGNVYSNAPTIPTWFDIQRDQQAMTHVNRAFWNSKIALLHAAAMSGADDLVRKLLETGSDVNVKARAGECKIDYESFPRLTPLELSVSYNRPTTVAILLSAGAIIGRSWELALDGARLETTGLILAQDPHIAKRFMPSDVGPPTMGTFMYHRQGWALAGRVYRPLPPSLVSELIRAGADMYFKWKWDDGEADQSLMRAIQLGWDEVALVLASEWAGAKDLNQLLTNKWDAGKENLVSRCIGVLEQRGIIPSK